MFFFYTNDFFFVSNYYHIFCQQFILIVLCKQIIGKMESYTQDALAVLDRVNLTWILDGVDHHQHMLQEVEMLAIYNFQVNSLH